MLRPIPVTLTPDINNGVFHIYTCEEIVQAGLALDNMTGADTSFLCTCQASFVRQNVRPAVIYHSLFYLPSIGGGLVPAVYKHKTFYGVQSLRIAESDAKFFSTYRVVGVS